MTSRPSPPPASGHDRAQRKRRREGFALLITITLLAFLVLLLVSLSTLTRVETQVASNNRQLAQARQHALMGLNVALGRLQELAGPDQRVTATADLLKDRHLDRKRWTGVWNADPAASDVSGHGRNLGWLVSGNVPAGVAGMDTEVTAESGNFLVDLVGENTVDIGTSGSPTGERVRVETQPIKSSAIPGLPASAGGHTIGNFAYWVGDENVKAKLSLTDPHANKPADTRIYSFIAAQRSAGELVEWESGAVLGASYPANEPGLSRVVTPAQLPLVSTNATARTALRAAARHRFHEISFNSSSVMADVVAGGLKKDLTAWLSSTTLAPGAPADTEFIAAVSNDADNAADLLPQWGLVRSYAALTGDRDTALSPRVQTGTEVGVYPIVTYFRIGIGLSCAGDDQPLNVHLFPEVVLWNPTNAPIAPSRYKVGLRIQGIIQFQINGTTKTQLNLDKTALDVSGTWPPSYFRFEIRHDDPLPPGESLVFTPADDGVYDPNGVSLATLTAENPPNRAGSVVLQGPSLTAAERALPITWVMPENGGAAYIALWPITSAATEPDDAYQNIRRIGYGRPAVPDAGIAPPVIIAPRIVYRFQATMSRGVATHITSRWMAQQNMRAPLIDRTGAETGNLPLYYGIANTSVTPIDVDENRAAAGLSVSRVPDSADRLILTEVPLPGVPLFSLAQLQHANLARAGYYSNYAVGNSLPHVAIPLGDLQRTATQRLHDLSYVLNRALWDRYFFSTAPADLTQADIDSDTYRLPNARHVFARTRPTAPDDVSGHSAYHTAAAHLLIDGGFNVNSTSVDAWKTLLASRHGVAYDPVSRDTGPALDYPFSRFTAPAGGPNNPWEGHRTLTEDAIDGLAHRIVEQVKARGPFLSLADFINRRLVDNPDTTLDERYAGTLQAALDAYDVDTSVPTADRINLRPPFDADAVTSSSGTTWDIKRMQGGDTSAYPRSSRSYFAPGYLSQADILNAIGPVLAARSDTFVIRAYGDVRNPVTGAEEGSALCEAVVQRLPEFVVSSEAPETWPVTEPDNQRFGRRYRIISFRWLTPDDI